MTTAVEDIAERARECGQIIAESQAMREIIKFIRRVAVSEASSILVEGESGTGKDLVATTLHDLSPRQAGPFVAINCAAIPETLLESELFGFEKSAFTDARTTKPGLIELAHRGTLFLDDIGGIAGSLQAKLLRVLENKCLRRLGGLNDVNVDIRIITASNRDLRKMVKDGTFRQDLYYRLNVIPIFIPPLRERIADILPLALFFIQNFNRRFSHQLDTVTAEAQNLLLMHEWPGNVRELRNAIEHAMILEETASLRPESLPAAVRGGPYSRTMADAANGSSFTGDGMSWAEVERSLLIQSLQRTGGNQTRAALLLGITRDTLRYRMKKFHLE
jgi:transcriptional regulator with PAS, ATPase and Fis domain